MERKWRKMEMSKVVLVRVDSRLIHGQVVLKCLKETKAKRILIVHIRSDPARFPVKHLRKRFNLRRVRYVLRFFRFRRKRQDRGRWV